MSLSSVPSMSITWRCESLAPGATIAGRYSTGPGARASTRRWRPAAPVPTRTSCALGDDAGGATARELAAQDGFALIAEASSEPTGTAGIYVDARGRNTIVIGPGANAALGTDFLQQQQALLTRAKVVLVQLESPVQTIEAALAGPRGRCHHRTQYRTGRCALDHRPAQAGRCDHPERNRVRCPARPPCR